MNFFGKKETKTVNTVFATFTKDLEEVTAQQKAVISEAKATKKNLREQRNKIEDRIDLATTRENIAEGEINQAAEAIKNIGAMLGIQPKG